MAGNRDYRPDLEPGFWANYQEPTPLAQAIQYPLADPKWQSRVLNAYIKKVKNGKPDSNQAASV